MSWNVITENEQLEALQSASHHKPQLIFKHSTRCNISTIAKNRLEQDLEDVTDQVDFHFLDLIAHRPLSNHIADQYAVPHQSPQVLLIHAGECVLEQTHYDIRMDEILEVAEGLPVQ